MADELGSVNLKFPIPVKQEGGGTVEVRKVRKFFIYLSKIYLKKSHVEIGKQLGIKGNSVSMILKRMEVPSDVDSIFDEIMDVTM